DVISSFGGKTSYDADNRPLLVMRSNLWASGYDVDGTDQTSLGQFSGRVQQTYKHSVPRFFVPEHGTMFTLALVRSEERFSRNAETDLVCRLLLEKKKCVLIMFQDTGSVSVSTLQDALCSAKGLHEL